MFPISSIEPLYSIAGFAVGALVGITGVGGGSLMTPLLILLFGVHPAMAVGTDLLYAAATKGVGSFVHGLCHTVDWRVVRRLAMGSLPTTFLTMFILNCLNIKGASAHELITAVLTAALFVTAVTLVLREKIIRFCSARVGALDPQRTAVLTVGMGAVLGVLVSISSVGAGAIGVTALVLLYPQLPTARIVGSDIAHAVPLTLVAGIGHWLLGSVDWHIFASLLVGSLPGIALGSYVAARVPETALRMILAGTLIVVASKLSFGLHPFSFPELASIASH